MDDGAVARGSGNEQDPLGETAPAQALGPVIQRRLVSWDPQGNPVVIVVPTMPLKQMQNAPAAALSLLYEGPEKRYQGMTCLEVNLVKRAQAAALSGDPVDGETLLDRAIGKPKSSSENVNVNLNGSYEDFLREKAGPAAAPPEPVFIHTYAERVDPVDPLA